MLFPGLKRIKLSPLPHCKTYDKVGLTLKVWTSEGLSGFPSACALVTLSNLQFCGFLLPSFTFRVLILVLLYLEYTNLPYIYQAKGLHLSRLSTQVACLLEASLTGHPTS